MNEIFFDKSLNSSRNHGAKSVTGGKRQFDRFHGSEILFYLSAPLLSVYAYTTVYVIACTLIIKGYKNIDSLPTTIPR